MDRMSPKKRSEAPKSRKADVAKPVSAPVYRRRQPHDVILRRLHSALTLEAACAVVQLDASLQDQGFRDLIADLIACPNEVVKKKKMRVLYDCLNGDYSQMRCVDVYPHLALEQRLREAAYPPSLCLRASNGDYDHADIYLVPQDSKVGEDRPLVDMDAFL